MNYAQNRAVNAYRTANTAVPPVKAVAMLLDEALNAIVLTAYYIKRKEFESAFGRVVHASKILSGLRQNVNLDVDPQMGQQFIDMYTSNIFALHNAYGRDDAIQRYATLASGILEFRNAWAEIARMQQRSIDTVMGGILDQKDEVVAAEAV
ncbi:flagellar protein FliS [uncultured Cohaesibacter sp.]|uniref:flagellar export chaperone FliS n=1 Tax=uncultured Cohaesibacter sp. TaxID=1002546 RepID=UPI002AAB5DA8|nr:flagellar protein FliS [uncultured Cohaesibacter sp.]